MRKSQWYITAIKPQIVENEAGQFEVWAEKTIADNRYMFFANQISVKAFGQHYHVDSQYPRLRCVKYEPTCLSYLEPLNSTLGMEEYDIQLMRLRFHFKGRITELKRSFSYFKSSIKYAHNKNKITKVS